MASAFPSLLLLPQPPTPITRASLSAAYRPTLESTVSVLRGLSTSTELLITLPCPSLRGRFSKPRSNIYADVQQLLAGIYSLFCIVCAKLEVEVESDVPGSVDARIVLLDYDSHHVSTELDALVNPFVCGPIIDLPTLALTRRQWNLIFAVDGEEGQKLLASYTNLSNKISPPLHGHVTSVSGGVSLQASQKVPESLSTPPASTKVHKVVAVGGTFDHIHAGHKLLLSATALLLQPASLEKYTARRLIVGITGDELLKNKQYAEYLNSWKKRQEDVVNFLLSTMLFTRSSLEDSVEISSFEDPIQKGRAVHTKLKASCLTIECVEIQDPFGPTITDESVTALVVSGETRSGGQAVNQKRTEKGWNALEVYEIDVLDSQDYDDSPSKTEDFASKISSTAIRQREADRKRTSSL